MTIRDGKGADGLTYQDRSETPWDSAAAALRELVPEPPDVLLVLGSGLASLIDVVEHPAVLEFSAVPGFARTGVVGHPGRYVAGTMEGRRVLVQAGRFHYYEGHAASVVSMPIRLAARVGARRVILTNAAGGIGAHLAPGTVVLIQDHLNLQWRAPLAGPVEFNEQRFPDMSSPYDPKLMELAVAVAAELRIPLPKGTYAAVLGPSFETPAEIRMLTTLGADVVGMSTVPEVITARALGIPVLGLSLVTNQAAGTGPDRLGHDEVLQVGRSSGATLIRLIRALVGRLTDDRS